MYANRRVKIIALSGYDLLETPEVVGFHGVVDRFGLTPWRSGWCYGGIELDKLGYCIFEQVKVELEPCELGDNITLGYN